MKDLIDSYKKIKWKDLLREDLGKHSLKELKPHLDFIKNFMDFVIDHHHLLSESQQHTLEDWLSRLNNLVESIKQHKDIGKNLELINIVTTFKGDLNTIIGPLHDSIRREKAYNPNLTEQPEGDLEKYRSIQKEIKEIKEFKEALIKKQGELDQKESQLSEAQIKKETQLYGDFFGKEAKRNKNSSFWFGGALLVCSIGFALFAYCYFQVDPNINANSFAELLIKGNVLNNVFIFAIFFLILSTLRKEYLALRHQFTLNRHRQNALNSHKEILTSIKKTKNESDTEISNAILLELTKSMFDPQDTGFVRDQKGSTGDSKIIEISKSLFRSKD